MGHEPWGSGRVEHLAQEAATTGLVCRRVAGTCRRGSWLHSLALALALALACRHAGGLDSTAGRRRAAAWQRGRVAQVGSRQWQRGASAGTDTDSDTDSHSSHSQSHCPIVSSHATD
jgi:hypothetical protein